MGKYSVIKIPFMLNVPPYCKKYIICHKRKYMADKFCEENHIDDLLTKIAFNNKIIITLLFFPHINFLAVNHDILNTKWTINHNNKRGKEMKNIKTFYLIRREKSIKQSNFRFKERKEKKAKIELIRSNFYS